jgi:hypothetical protein
MVLLINYSSESFPANEHYGSIFNVSLKFRNDIVN